MNDTYSCSYVEVLEILKHIPKKDYEKIPKEKIEFYKNNIDKNYRYIYDEISPKTLRKTDTILINLYKNYIATAEEKIKIEQILKLNERKLEKEKQQLYNPNNLFKNQKEETQINDMSTLSMVQYKESVFKKIINRIKKILHINYV